MELTPFDHGEAEQWDTYRTGVPPYNPETAVNMRPLLTG